ncbi:GTP-binding protein [Methanimicrococcus blatticola]|uniref:G3E family GTPase n=1 Tax=Methanimicrococcus blatticola TaxID=91560 RepID=A0A484F2H5_9EURY|nr:GTP-binding protein [Methanimicrococcus blatticola]MBZ3936425.1 GTP-binding protein [Methanimicrococcus blatticola]MCC2509495.1 GTP-binding protein [Methanimicrococcus blatticola]TDQ67546.1 G3E family GTPase [Methanimicrococcus blatticola]
MKIIVVGGFLGSGKTTALIRLGTYYSSIGKVVGIIVNEIGEIGIDGDVISQYGLETKEITSGCICCSLKTSLRATLLSMIDNFHPDVVIIESTGVAYPGVIRDEVMLMNLPMDYDMAPLLTLFDGSRFKQILKEIKNFASQQLAQAEVIAVSKADLVEPSMLPIIESAVQQINPKAEIITLSSKNPESLAHLIDILERNEDIESRLAELKKVISNDGSLLMAGGKPKDNSVEASGVGSFAVEYSLDQNNLNTLIESDLEKVVRDIMSLIRSDVLEKSPDFLGHIKLFLESGSALYKISLTTAEEEPIYDFIPSANEINSFSPNLKILSAVTGLKSDEVQKIVQTAVEKILDENGVIFNI